MKKFLLIKARGFTLVEILVAVGVTALVSGILGGILINNNGVMYKQNSIINEGLSLNDAMTAIDDKIRQAAEVAIGYPEESPTYQTGLNTLVLKVPSENSWGIINNTYDYVVILQDTGNAKILRLKVFPDSQSTRKSEDRVLTTVTDYIQFSYLDKSGNAITPASAYQVGVNLSVSPQTGSIGSNRSSSTITTLRNTSL